MNMFLTGSIYKVNFSASKKTEIFDTEIDELYKLPKTIIKTSDDFWNFFNDTSSAIPTFLPDDRSHQYLVNNAYIESDGSIIVWTDDNIDITFNDVSRIYQDSRSLAEQVIALQFIIQDASNNDNEVVDTGLYVKVPNGSFENWTGGSLDDWVVSWANPMPRVLPIGGSDGGSGVKIETTEYFTETEEYSDLLIRHSAINLPGDKVLWFEPETTYKLSGMCKASGNSARAEIFIGDTRGGNKGNNHDYSWRKNFYGDIGVEDWTPFETYFVPKPNIYTKNGLPYLGCQGTIYLYNGTGYYGGACYDNLKVEKILNYTGSDDNTIYGVVDPLEIYSLRYSTDENGRLLSPASQSVTSGDDGLLVSAEAIGDYYFVSWSDGVSTVDRQDMNVSNDIDVTAYFSVNLPHYTLSYNAGGGFWLYTASLGNTISQSVELGGDGYVLPFVTGVLTSFINWSDGRTDNPRQDTNVTSSINVTASFDVWSPL